MPHIRRFCTGARPPSPRDAWDSSEDSATFEELFAPVKASDQLSIEHRGQFYPFKEAVVPEAFQQWHTHRRRRDSKPTVCEGGGSIPPLPNFTAGCVGLQYEFSLSGYPYLMCRPTLSALWEVLASGEEASRRRVLAHGPPGCGKSVMLAATVERLRQQGWVVMYIPDVEDITKHSATCVPNPETGMWDTRQAARRILRSVADAHGETLRELPQQVEGGEGTLFDLCNVSDVAGDASVCNAVVRLKLELYRVSSVRTAIVIDHYNALFWRTEYIQAGPSLEDPMRPIDAQELTLCANLRVLGDDVQNSVVLVAPCMTRGTPHLNNGMQFGVQPHSRFAVQPFSAAELGRWLKYQRYVEGIAPSQAITLKGVQAAHQLTQGNGTMARRDLHFLLPYDPSLDDLDATGLRYTNVSLYR